MKKIIFLICLVSLIILNSGTVLAENIDAVVLATSSHYPDTLVAAVAADKIGSPLLLTDPGQLPNETISQIQDLGVKTIYIIGGNYVVNQKVEEELKQNYEVVRIWGQTRFGTSAEVANYFWSTGSSKAIIAWDVLGLPNKENSELLATTRDLAMREEMPLLLVPGGTLPSETSEVLQNLSVSEVVLVGNVNNNVIQAIEDLGINITEHISGNTVEDIKQKVRTRVRERIRINTSTPLVIVAVGNWSDVVKAPYRPNGTSRLISSEGQIDDLVTEINEGNYSNIMIVGKPDLAQKIYDRLISENISAELISGRLVAVAAKIMEKARTTIKNRIRTIKGTDKINPNLTIEIRPMNITANKNVIFTAKAIDNVRIKNIKIYIDDAILKTCTSSSCIYRTSYPYVGSHVLLVTTEDLAGNMVSESKNFEVE